MAVFRFDAGILRQNLFDMHLIYRFFSCILSIYTKEMEEKI